MADAAANLAWIIAWIIRKEWRFALGSLGLEGWIFPATDQGQQRLREIRSPKQEETVTQNR